MKFYTGLGRFTENPLTEKSSKKLFDWKKIHWIRISPNYIILKIHIHRKILCKHKGWVIHKLWAECFSFECEKISTWQNGQWKWFAYFDNQKRKSKNHRLIELCTVYVKETCASIKIVAYHRGENFRIKKYEVLDERIKRCIDRYDPNNKLPFLRGIAHCLHSF